MLREERRRQTEQVALLSSRAVATAKIDVSDNTRMNAGQKPKQGQGERKRSSAPSTPRKPRTLAHNANAESYIFSGKWVNSGKDKKEGLTILTPSLQPDHHLLSDTPALATYRRSLRDISAAVAPTTSRNNTPRSPVHFLKHRIHFDSPGLQRIEAQPIDISLDVSPEPESGSITHEHPVPSIDQDHENWSNAMEIFVESAAKLHHGIMSHFNQVGEIKKELIINHELLISLSSTQPAHPKSVDQSMSNQSPLLASLRSDNGLDPDIDPRRRRQHDAVSTLNSDVACLLEDINNDASHMDKIIQDPLIIERCAYDASQSIRHVVDLTGLFRRALRTVAIDYIGMGWVLESCWKGMALLYQCTVAREKAYIQQVDAHMENADLVAHSTKNGAIPEQVSAVDRLHDSFDIDVYKKIIDGLQNDLYEIKKENISLRGRINEIQLQNPQRFEPNVPKSQSYHPDIIENQSEQLIYNVHGEKRFFPMRASAVGIHQPIKPTPLGQGRGRTNRFYDQTKKSKDHQANQDIYLHERERNLFAIRSIGLYRMSLPSTTIDPVSLDLIVGRIPQVIAHALQAYRTASEPPPLQSDRELHRLSLEIMLELAGDYGYTSQHIKRPSHVCTYLQLADFILIFFQMRHGTKIKADIEMGRFCSSLQAFQKQDSSPTKSATIPLTLMMGKFLGLSRTNLQHQALRMVLFALKQWHNNDSVRTIHHEAQESFLKTLSRGILTKTIALPDEQLVARDVDFYDPDLLIPLEIAETILQQTYDYFRFSSTIEMARSHLEGEVILVDGSSIDPGHMKISLTIYRIHEGIRRRLRMNALTEGDICQLFRRADSRKCGRMPMLQFISCIRSLRCGISDNEIISVVELFDASTKNFQQVDYRKFSEVFTPMTLFVSVHTVISSITTLWSYETSLNESTAIRKFVCNDFKQRVSDLSEFTVIIKSIVPGISPRKAATLFQECLAISATNFVTRDTFITMSRVHSLFNNDPM